MISYMKLFLPGYIYDIIYDIIYFMISYMISYVFILISYSISYMISYKNLWYHVWYHIYPFLALLWYCQKDMISYMISYCNYDIIYDIISFFQYHSHLPVSCAIIMPYQIRYHIHITQNLLWYQNYMILSMILTMIWPSDISITWYHSHMMPHIWWYYSLYHVTCAAGWRGLGAPCARCSTSSCLAIANVLGTCVQLNGDGLDPAHGLVAKAAARVVHSCRFVVVEKRRLAGGLCSPCRQSADG